MQLGGLKIAVQLSFDPIPPKKKCRPNMHATYSYEELKFLVGKVFLSARRSFCRT